MLNGDDKMVDLSVEPSVSLEQGDIESLFVPASQHWNNLTASSFETQNTPANEARIVSCVSLRHLQAAVSSLKATRERHT